MQPWPELPIAVDAMGGDHGPQPVIEGALAAVRQGASVVLVGDTTVAETLSRFASPREAAAIRIVVATEHVTADEKPAVAMRRRQTSMRLACDEVEAGRACGVVSVANSGAMMATALAAFGRLPQVARPAIATVLPSFSSSGFTLLVDAGANVDCEPVHLVQWGLMGAVYMERVHAQVPARIGIASNGEEPTKGNDLTRKALALLRQTTGVGVVHGYCEGRDLNNGEVHVVVTDGLTGNLMLKTAEGVFSFMSGTIRRAFEQGSLLDKLAGLMAKPTFARVRAGLDPREFGCAPLLGLAKPAFIAHGKSDAYAVSCGLRTIARVVGHDVNAAITTALGNHASLWR